MTTELEKNTTTTTDSPYDNYETPTGNQFLITEPVENNTTTTEVAIHRLETPQKLGKKHNKNEKVF